MKMYKCRFPNCDELLSSSGYCAKHQAMQAKPFANASRSNESLYHTPQWRRLRNAQLKARPYCELCGTDKDLTIHHIRAPRGNMDLFFSPANLQTICKSCHRLLTAQEIRERARTGMGV